MMITSQVLLLIMFLFAMDDNVNSLNMALYSFRLMMVCIKLGSTYAKSIFFDVLHTFCLAYIYQQVSMSLYFYRSQIHQSKYD